MIADPPYGIGYVTTRNNDGAEASWKGDKMTGDESTALRDWIVEQRGSRPAAVFGTWKIKRPQGLKAVLIWDKGPAFGMGDLSFPWKNSFEEIYIFGEGWTGHRDEGVLRGHLVTSWESLDRVHPTQKPLSLIGHILEKAPPGVVCDPCMGSGTTLVAAKQLGRRAIGIEIEEKYIDVAIRRLAQEVLFK